MEILRWSSALQHLTSLQAYLNMDNMENNNPDQPDQINSPVPENEEIADAKDNQSLLVADPDLPSMQSKDSSKKVNLFHSVKLFFSGKFTRQKSPPKETIDQQNLEIDKKLADENEAQDKFVENRLGNFLAGQPEIITEPLTIELPEEEVHSDIILTDHSENPDSDQPQTENFANLPLEEKSPTEDPFEPALLLSPFFAKDIDDIDSYEEEEDSDSAITISEEISYIHNDEENEESALSEDQDLNERFLALLAQEETPETIQPAFFPEDLEDLNEFSQNENEEPVDDDPKDLALVDLPENWNKAFTSDPTTFVETTTFPNREVIEEEKEDESENSLPSLQQRLAQTRDLKKEKEEYSLILQNGLGQSEKTDEKKDENPEVDLEVSSPSTKVIENDEEPISNPWDTEPEWRSLVTAEEAPVEISPSDETIETANLGEPLKVIPEKGIFATIPLFAKIVIVFLFVVDIVIIGMVANSYQKIPFMAKATATVTPVIPTDVTYIYPNALKLTGGWIIQLNRGRLANDKWTPQSAEWLIDTAFRRVVALPWSKQLEAVTITLRPGDPIDLYMVNNDVIAYQVEQVTKVPQNDTSFLQRNTPALILILYRPDSQDRWVIICTQK